MTELREVLAEGGDLSDDAHGGDGTTWSYCTCTRWPRSMIGDMAA